MCDETGCSTYKDYYCNCSARNGSCQMQLCDFSRGDGNCVNLANRTCLAPPDYRSYGCNCYMFSQTFYEMAVNGRCNLGNVDSCHERIYSVEEAPNWYYSVESTENYCMRDSGCLFGFANYLSYFSYFCECESGQDCFDQGLKDPCKVKSLCGENATCLAYSSANQYFCRCDESSGKDCYKKSNPCKYWRLVVIGSRGR